MPIKTELSEKQKAEMQLWRDWKATKSINVLDQLLDSYAPVISNVVSTYSSAPLPKAAIEGEAISQVINAFNTYDPKKGAALNTHVFNNLQKVYRYVASYANVGKIPEARVAKVGIFNDVTAQLENKFNRNPSVQELSDELNWPQEEVVRMKREVAKDLSLEDLPFISAEQDDKTRNNLYFFYNSLSQENKIIFEGLTGLYGKKKTSESAVAKGLKMPLKEVRKRKNEMVIKIRSFM